jgi:mannose-6-phosphate isomerase-like protein (cupin superfamily)
MIPTFPQRLPGNLRRVETAIDARGKAVVVADERVAGDERAMTLWSCAAPPVAGRPATPLAQWWPGAGGVRVSLSTRRPDRLAARERPEGLPDIDDTAGFHASASADVILVISGRIWCELDDGVEIELTAGDCLVQNGTRHRWHNHGEDWPVIAAIIVGAQAGPQAGARSEA